MGIFFQALIC